ncbi:MAG TPA: murein biosynthesis integral membrane protein MurJ [Levilinea sp.]|nr:murein biosynthesis integral membrane protein MurJ [Levilinea sp.]
MDTQQPISANRQIARAAGTVMAAFILSNLFGLVRNILVLRAFGTSMELDSFNAANRVAELLFNLMAGGALGSAFIPTFTGLLAKEDQPLAWRLASSVANLLLVTLSAVGLLAAIFAPQIVRYGLFLLDPGANPYQEVLTVLLLRVLMPSIIVFGISGLVMGVLNAHQVFLVPAAAPAMYSLGIIIGVTLYPAEWGILRLAYGALTGALLHLLVQLPNLVRLGGRYTLSLGLRNPLVGEVARLMGPRVFGVAVVQLNFIVNTIIALSLPEGSISAITLAFSLMLMPQMAIAQSIAIAAMPTFSRQVATGRLVEMRASLAASLRMVLLLALPAAAGLILLRTPVITLLFTGSSSAFDERSVQLVAWALLWYGLGLVGHSVVEIVSRAFFALHDTRTPVMVGVAGMTLNIVFSLLFSSWFARLGWMPHGGLALSSSLATFLEMLALLYLLRRRLQGLEGMSIARAVMKSALAAGGMGAALWFWLAQFGGIPVVVQVAGGLVTGILVYGLLVVLLRVPEVRQGVMLVRSRLKPW